MQEAYGLVIDKLDQWYTSAVTMLPNMIVAVFVVVSTFLISRYMSGYIDKLLRFKIKEQSVRRFTVSGITLTIIACGFFLALSVLNLDKALTSILAGAGVAGLAVGLALQGTLSDTLAGVFLAVKDIMSIGDFVETNGYSGKVDQITLRYIKLIEPDNNIVVIPNKLIAENPFKNYGLTSQIRTSIECGVAYDSDLEEVKKIAVNTIKNNYPVSENSEIEFYFTSFADSSINFLLRFWVDATSKMTILEAKSEAIILIHKAFKENDIDIPFPIRTLNIGSEIPKEELSFLNN